MGPYTYMEFARNDDQTLLNVQLSHSEQEELARQIQLEPGSQVWLRPTRVTEFMDAGAGI